MKAPDVNARDLDKAALCGEPSYIWRAGQERRLRMILDAAGGRMQGRVLDNGTGVGMFVQHLAPYAGEVFGLEFDFYRLREARKASSHLLSAASENLPFPEASFDVILSHEVLEHVRDDRRVVSEMVRTLRPGGRMIVFVPNRGYPFETHGIYWRGQYRFGNIPLVNYLPRGWRDRLAPHVRVYASGDLERLFVNLPVKVIQKQIIFGAYDNIITRWPTLGRALRAILQALEHTPLRAFGLSHFWVLERI
jgi:SAM-dependent methyltransferase